MNSNRKYELRNGGNIKGPVVYWMQRDQRVKDNWALIEACNIAIERKEKLIILFFVDDQFEIVSRRQMNFMLQGLKQVEKDLNRLNISFIVEPGLNTKTIIKTLEKVNPSWLVTDLNPLRKIVQIKKELVQNINIPIMEVDAHNIVPVWKASDKQEYAAYTIRKKIHRIIPEYLDGFPELKKFAGENTTVKTDWKKIEKSLEVQPYYNFESGENAAKNMLDKFIKNKLENYNALRNDPTKGMLSELSPYLHFGQISAQKIVQLVKPFTEYKDSLDSFFDELIIRRELTDNYCFYNENYDTPKGYPNWAIESLDNHLGDKREFLYSFKQFENAETHDELWNAAQNELTGNGKIHGYMRMYWAKKILEWTENYEEAHGIAIGLNDKYSIDGIDPNGYVGVAWSIGGLHDRPWFERPIFGKVRYMNFNGCKRKFDVQKYISANRTFTNNK